MCASKDQANGEAPEQSGIEPDIDHEWEARRARFHNVGYKEGLEEGKARTLQQGFDEGYKHGAQKGFQDGVSRGLEVTREALTQLTAKGASRARTPQQNSPA